jgi:response regulator RpfG family c-di-GMP phosphodiesterase
VAIAAQAPIDLVVVDWNQAPAEAIDLCWRLRIRSNTHHIPIILVGAPADAPAGRGVFDVRLHDSMLMEDLLAAISQVLSPTPRALRAKVWETSPERPRRQRACG